MQLAVCDMRVSLMNIPCTPNIGYGCKIWSWVFAEAFVESLRAEVSEERNESENKDEVDPPDFEIDQCFQHCDDDKLQIEQVYGF